MSKGLKKLVIALGVFIVVGGIAFVSGLVLASPPEVVAELAGPKKDWVGSWRSAAGKASTLAIDPQGNVKFVQNEGGSYTETLTAPIAAFDGNDMKFRALVKMTVPSASRRSRSAITGR